MACNPWHMYIVRVAYHATPTLDFAKAGDFFENFSNNKKKNTANISYF